MNKEHQLSFLLPITSAKAVVNSEKTNPEVPQKMVEKRYVSIKRTLQMKGIIKTKSF